MPANSVAAVARPSAEEVVVIELVFFVVLVGQLGPEIGQQVRAFFVEVGGLVFEVLRIEEAGT